MCSPSIVGITALTSRAVEGKPLIGQDIVPRVRVPAVNPPKDLSGEKKRQAFRATQRTLAGRPGPGRAANIFSRGTGAGPLGLKTGAGQ